MSAVYVHPNRPDSTPLGFRLHPPRFPTQPLQVSGPTSPVFLSNRCRIATIFAQKNPLGGSEKLWGLRKTLGGGVGGGQGWIWVTSRTAPLSAEVVMAA